MTNYDVPRMISLLESTYNTDSYWTKSRRTMILWWIFAEKTDEGGHLGSSRGVSTGGFAGRGRTWNEGGMHALDTQERYYRSVNMMNKQDISDIISYLDTSKRGIPVV